MSKMFTTICYNGIRQVPVWYAEGLRIIIFRYGKCNCKQCKFCKETEKQADEWLKYYGH